MFYYTPGINFKEPDVTVYHVEFQAGSSGQYLRDIVPAL